MPRNTLIQIRRGTSAEWNEANPVLSAGEPGLETDTRKIKHGDGVTPWFDLPYASGTLSISDVTGLQGALNDKAPAAGSTGIVTVGSVTATSVNKVTITQPSTGATLTLANGKTLTANNTVSLDGQDGASVSLGAGGTVMYETSIIDGGSY